MPVDLKLHIKRTCACLGTILALGITLPAGQAEAILDNNGEVSGLFVSVFGAGGPYPAMEYILAFPGQGGSGSSGTQTDLLGKYHNIGLRTYDSLSQEELDELAAISGLPEINGLELFIVGEYSNSRCMNFSLYDNHSIPTDALLDIEVEPISDSYINPFDTIYSENRFDFNINEANYYYIKIRLGDDFVDEETVDPTCSLSSYNVTGNLLDATVRHGQEQAWLLPSGTGEFEWLQEFDPSRPDLDPGPTLGGHFGVRRYGDRTPDTPTPHLFKPLLLLRETSTGCPIPFRIQEAGGELTEYDISHTVATNRGFGDHIPGALQVQHVEFHNDHGNIWTGIFHATVPEGGESPVPTIDPYNRGLYWTAGKPYVAAVNPYLGYLMGRFLYDYTPAFTDEFSYPVEEDPYVLVVHVKIPTEPGFPCEDPGPEGCPGAAGSELRYWSISMTDITGEAVYSFARENLAVVDEETGVASIVFSFLDTGQDPHERPADLDPRFNWVHVPSEYRGQNPDAPYDVVNMPVRMQLSDEGDPFSCSCYNVPPGFGEHTPDGVIGSHAGGGFMGDYAPQTFIVRLSNLIVYQDSIMFRADPVGGDCTTTYDPFDYADEWWKLLYLPFPMP